MATFRPGTGAVLFSEAGRSLTASPGQR